MTLLAVMEEKVTAVIELDATSGKAGGATAQWHVRRRFGDVDKRD